MMIYRYIKMVFFTLSFLLAINMSAQDNFKNEDAMIKEANELFQNEEYIKAFEYYQTLLSNHRDNDIYNYRFGVCIMFSDKRDKEKPIRYLEKAAKVEDMDVRVFYFLGKAYHQNYRFAEAKVAYNEYKTKAKAKIVEKYDIDRRIQECNNGLSLLSSIHLLYVINKVEVKESTFYRTYNMKSSGGMVIIKPEALKTKYDKKHNTDQTAFYIPENRILYFSSYGVKNISGKDIYRAQQLADGNWSNPEKLGSNINTTYDDAFPFVTADGKSLYFSSKGHNSMGGFDIFKSDFNIGSFSWMKPENLNFPINTPFDDIFYVPDTVGKFASFSSTRSSVDGLVYVYKIGTDKQEEEQDFSKVLTEGGNIEEAIKLIKDVAELKTNINVNDYKQKIKDIGDTARVAQTEVPEEVIINNNDVAAASATTGLSSLEAIDSTFEVYRDVQYRLVGLKKQKESIQNIYHKNQIAAKEIIAAQGVSGAKEAAKHKKAADVAMKIGAEINQEISSSEQASEQIMDMATNMQYYSGRGMDDSVRAIYVRVNSLNKSIAHTDEIAQKIVDAQFKEVKKERDNASKFYELSNSYEKDIANLKSERDEYSAEAERVTDPDEKAEYKELVAEMDAEIDKKINEQEMYTAKWKSSRKAADSLSEQVSFVDEQIDVYNKETENINFATQNYIATNDVQKVDSEIAKVKAEVPSEAIAVNTQSNNKSGNEQTNETNQATNTDGGTNVVAGVTTAVVAGGVAVTAKNNASQNDNNVSENVDEQIAEASSELSNAEYISMLKKTDNAIELLEKEKKLLSQKSIIASNIGAAKYDDFQKKAQKAESDYSIISLNNTSTPEQKLQNLNQLKKEVEKSNKIKREAAAAFALSQEFDHEANSVDSLIVLAKQRKVEAIALLKKDQKDEAQLKIDEVNSYAVLSSEDVITQRNKEELIVVSKQDNYYQYKLDSITAIAEKLDREQKASAQYTSVSMEKEKIASVADKKQSERMVLEQMLITQKEVDGKYATINESTELLASNTPKELQTKAGVMTAFSHKTYDRNMLTINDAIAAVQTNSTVVVASASNSSEDPLFIPIYPSEPQNIIAEDITKPRVEVIKSIQKENEQNDKSIVVTLKMAKKNSLKLKDKEVEIENAYAQIDQSKPLSEQPTQVAKVKALEKEQLELNRKVEVEMQYVNILKKQQNENNKHVELLTKEVVESKSYIAKNQLDSARAIENQTAYISALTHQSGDFVADHLEVYNDENDVIGQKITGLNKEYNNIEILKTRSENKIAEIEHIDNPTQDQLNEKASQKEKLANLNKQSLANVQKRDSLKAVQESNTLIATLVREHSDYINNVADLSTVDSAQIARASMIRIVEVDNEIFNPNYLENHSLVEDEEPIIAVAEQKEEATDDEIEEIQAKLTTNDAPYIKVSIIQYELKTIDEEILILAQTRAESRNPEEKDSLTKEIRGLNIQKINLSDDLDRADMEIDQAEAQGFEPVYEEQLIDINKAIVGLQNKEDSLSKRAVTLREEAKGMRGKSKQSKLEEADQNDELALEMSLALTEIIAMRNDAEYHKNNLTIARFSKEQLDDARMQNAKILVTFANQNKEAARARREMVASGDYSEEEQVDLLSEAEDYEQQALVNQRDALVAFDNVGIIAVNAVEEDEPQLIAGNDRAAEEIPSDSETVDSNDNMQLDESETLAENQNEQGTEANINEANTNVNAGGVAIIPVVVAGSDDEQAVDTTNTAEEQIAENTQSDEGETLAENQNEQGTEANTNEANTNVNAGGVAIIPVVVAGSDDEQAVDTTNTAEEQIAENTQTDEGETLAENQNEQEVNTNEANTNVNAGGVAIIPVVVAGSDDEQAVDTTNTTDEQIAENTQTDEGETLAENQNEQGTEANTNEANTNVDANGVAIIPVVVAGSDDEQAVDTTNTVEEQVAENTQSDESETLAENQNEQGTEANTNEANTNVNTGGVAIIPVVVAGSDDEQAVDTTNTTDEQVAENTQSDENETLAENQNEQGTEANTNEANTNVNAGGVAIIPVVVAGSDEEQAVDTTNTTDEQIAENVIVEESQAEQNQGEVEIADNQEVPAETEIPNTTETEVVNTAKLIALGVEYNTPMSPEADAVSIPNNTEVIPGGLVYKVQMAAFRNPVPISTFKGITPVSAETSPSSAFIRYVGGVFPNYNEAATARGIIRGKGFSDAFVVVYFNGKRISVAEARRLIASGEAYTSNNLAQFAINNNTEYYVLNKAGGEQIAQVDNSVEEIQSQTEVVNNDLSTDGLGIEYNKDVAEEAVPLNSEVNLKGLVFKVQLDALKKKVPMSNFNGISPVAVEQLSNSELYYYVAGVFPNYVTAASARDIIQTKGYPGAFVVVYFNGQRISTEDANLLIKDGKAFTEPTLAKFAFSNNMKYYGLNGDLAQRPGNEEEQANSDTGLPKVTLFYSVQIGVYGGPRTADRLFNIKDLYFDRTKSGYYRYFAGKFDNETSAKTSRDQIRRIGVKDAFLVAFRDGQRVSLAEARKLEKDAKNQIIALSRKGNISTVAVQENTVQTSQTPVVQSAKSAEGIVFRVQLGAYKGTRNSAQLKVINSMSENGISSYTTPSGLTIYFTNSYPTYQAAKAARLRIVAAGHTDVFVVALQNGQKINVRTALDLLGQ